MYGIGFYDEYITRLGNLRDKPDLATPYKIAYLKKLIKNNEVYKFISFQKNAETKLKTLKEGKIWFSFYKTLNDETEFQIDYRIKKIVNETGYKKGYIELIINYLTEMYDVFSLTYTYEEYMWDAYASEGNGICVVYNVGNYDQLYPVEYCEKNTLDFTKMIINALKRKSFELSIIPWVVKNPYNETAKLDSTKEKEVEDAPIKVFIMGHSLGMTDKEILKEFFYGKYVSEITIYYHNQYAYEQLVISLVNMFGKEFVIEQTGSNRIKFIQLDSPIKVSVENEMIF